MPFLAPPLRHTLTPPPPLYTPQPRRQQAGSLRYAKISQDCDPIRRGNFPLPPSSFACGAHMSHTRGTINASQCLFSYSGRYFWAEISPTADLSDMWLDPERHCKGNTKMWRGRGKILSPPPSLTDNRLPGGCDRILSSLHVHE